MIHLLDANALLALGFREHEFHDRVARWVNTLGEDDELASSPITELAFVRVLAQVPQYHVTIEQARTLLAKLKTARARRFVFLADDRGIEHLPRWVKTARQTTDGHLSELAKHHGAVLATTDERIPGALLIPA